MDAWMIGCFVSVALFLIALITAICYWWSARKSRIELEEQKKQVDFLRERIVSQGERAREADKLRKRLETLTTEKESLVREKNELIEKVDSLNGEIDRLNEYAGVVGKAALNTNNTYAKLLKENEELKKQLNQQ